MHIVGHRSLDELRGIREAALASLACRRYEYKKSGEMFYISDVVFAHAEGGGLALSYIYAPLEPLGFEAPFVREFDEFHEKFEAVPDEAPPNPNAPKKGPLEP